MGTWGMDSFANDDAMDWVAELEAAPDLGAVRAALEAAARSDGGSLDASVAATALAAAQVVAALGGRPAEQLPDAVSAWVAPRAGAPNEALFRLATRAIAAVADDPATSELRELWDEAEPESRAAWLDGVADLRRRLA